MTRDRLLVLVEETLESLVDSLFGRFVVDSSLVSVLAFWLFFFFRCLVFLFAGIFLFGGCGVFIFRTAYPGSALKPSFLHN